MNTIHKGFGFHDVFYDGAQFMWDRQGFPAAYAPADGGNGHNVRRESG